MNNFQLVLRLIQSLFGTFAVAVALQKTKGATARGRPATTPIDQGSAAPDSLKNAFCSSRSTCRRPLQEFLGPEGPALLLPIVGVASALRGARVLVGAANEGPSP